MSDLSTFNLVADRLEAKERAAGVPVGLWRTLDAVDWARRVLAGLRRRIALEARR